LFRRQRILPLLGLQHHRGFLHRLRCRPHFALEGREFLILAAQFALLHALGKRIGLIAKLRLYVRKELAGLSLLRVGRFLVLELVERGRDDFLLALGDLVVILLAAAAATTATTRLGLRILF